VKLPKKHFANVKFRNLNEYRPVTDDFPEPIKKTKPLRGLAAKRVAGPSLPALLPLNDERSDEEESGDEEEDNISVISERCNSSDDDGNAADTECEEGQRRPKQTRMPPPQELACQVEQVIVSDQKDADGVDRQMQVEAENNKTVQEMAYFGVENVLTGQNPGLLDQKGLENVLKALLVVNKHILSDFFVDKCFPNSSESNLHQVARGERRKRPIFVLDIFIDGAAIFKNSKTPTCIPIMGESKQMSSLRIPEWVTHFHSYSNVQQCLEYCQKDRSENVRYAFSYVFKHTAAFRILSERPFRKCSIHIFIRIQTYNSVISHFVGKVVPTLFE
jgi:hypothetical protein